MIKKHCFYKKIQRILDCDWSVVSFHTQVLLYIDAKYMSGGICAHRATQAYRGVAVLEEKSPTVLLVKTAPPASHTVRQKQK